MKIFSFSLFVVLFTTISFGVAIIDAFAVDIIMEPEMGEFGCQEKPEGCIFPKSVNTRIGIDLIFINNDIETHYFVSGTTDEGPDDLFRTGLIYSGNSFTWNVDTVGNIPYFCLIHPWISGNIISSGSAPTPVAPTPVAPTPVAPTPVAPTPVAPTPVAPTPVAPTPVAPKTSENNVKSVNPTCGPGTELVNGFCQAINFDSSLAKNKMIKNSSTYNNFYEQIWNYLTTNSISVMLLVFLLMMISFILIQRRSQKITISKIISKQKTLSEIPLSQINKPIEVLDVDTPVSTEPIDTPVSTEPIDTPVSTEPMIKASATLIKPRIDTPVAPEPIDTPVSTEPMIKASATLIKSISDVSSEKLINLLETVSNQLDQFSKQSFSTPTNIPFHYYSLNQLEELIDYNESLISQQRNRDPNYHPKDELLKEIQLMRYSKYYKQGEVPVKLNDIFYSSLIFSNNSNNYYKVIGVSDDDSTCTVKQINFILGDDAPNYEILLESEPILLSIKNSTIRNPLTGLTENTGEKQLHGKIFSPQDNTTFEVLYRFKGMDNIIKKLNKKENF